MPHQRNIYHTYYQKGFTALIAIILLSSVALAFSLVTMSAAVLYSDSVYAREVRIQNSLNQQACTDSISLMKSKDYFLKGQVNIPEFNCTVNVN